MKIIGVYISIFFGICCMGYAQVQTGAISIYNLCGNNGVDGGACDLSSMYSVFSPMTLPGATTYASNCGGTNASPGGCTGTTANSHIQAYISV